MHATTARRPVIAVSRRVSGPARAQPPDGGGVSRTIVFAKELWLERSADIPDRDDVATIHASSPDPCDAGSIDPGSTVVARAAAGRP